MTTITTYAELKQNIQDHVKRGDALSKLDMFIDLAEEDIAEDLRTREMETTETLTTSTSDRFVTLPTGYIKMRRLQIIVDGVYYDLDEKSSKNLQLNDHAGTPARYIVNDKIELDRISDEAYSLEIQYFKMPTALSSSNTTNVILTAHPYVYLCASLHHAFDWAMQHDLADRWYAKYQQAVARANYKARKGRYGAAPATFLHKGMVV